MSGDVQEAPQTRSNGKGWIWLCSLGVVVISYLLTTGPIMLLKEAEIIRDGSAVERAIEILYWPAAYVSEETILAKPLGFYWHFWVPELYDGNGSLIRGPSTREPVVLADIWQLLLLFQKGEPQYAHRSLFEWLDAYDTNSHFPDAEPPRSGFTDHEVEKALNVIGERALPYLLKWLHEEPRTANVAVRGIIFYSPMAKKIQPALIRMTLSQDRDLRIYGYEALYFTRPDKDVFLPVVYRGLKSSDDGIPRMSAQWLAERFPAEAEKAGLRQRYPELYADEHERTNGASSKVSQ